MMKKLVVVAFICFLVGDPVFAGPAEAKTHEAVVRQFLVESFAKVQAKGRVDIPAYPLMYVMLFGLLFRQLVNTATEDTSKPICIVDMAAGLAFWIVMSQALSIAFGMEGSTEPLRYSAIFFLLAFIVIGVDAYRLLNRNVYLASPRLWLFVFFVVIGFNPLTTYAVEVESHHAVLITLFVVQQVFAVLSKGPVALDKGCFLPRYESLLRSF